MSAPEDKLVAPAWQPIETAPKDGTSVLLCGGCTDELTDDSDFEGFEGDVSVEEAHRPVTGLWRGDRWIYATYDGGFYGKYEGPTHWMPLPLAPKGGAS